MYMALSGSLQQPHTVYLFLPLSIWFIPRRTEPAPAPVSRGGDMPAGYPAGSLRAR
jgi:hypothetical protein